MATPTPKARSQPSSKHIPINSSAQVRVVVRVRPFLPSEVESKDKGSAPCISVVDGEADRPSGQEITVHLKDQWTSRKESYKLDSFFGQGDEPAQIFHREISALIPGVFQGFNATIFAYGATGSGKTYTMQGTDEQPGLIPLAMTKILYLCENSGSLVEVAYYEIYMDRCYDLLEPKAKEIMVLEDKDGQVQLKGLSRVPVRSMSEFFEVFASGVQRRKTAHTGLNDVSSRSHGVLSIFVSDNAATGKLNLIDLAGNEDNRRTGNEGIRLLESAKINQSLFTLSNVIYALNNNEPRIPYRESKLTRILQDSLGGTSRALMIACLNPVSYPEAVHTVSLAARSRHIRNYVGADPKQETPKVKVDMEAKLRAWLESRGKTKSIQRMDGLLSPISARTPGSVSTKRPDSVRSSAKATIKDYGVSKGRKLFDSAVPVAPPQEGPLLSSVLSVAAGPVQEDGESFAEVKILHEKDVARHENSCTAGHDGHEDLRESSQETSSVGVKCEGQHAAILENYASTLMHCHLEPFKDVPLHDSDDKKENMCNTTNVDCLNLLACIPDTSSNKENTYVQCGKAGASPMVSESLWELQNSARKALSPIQSNMPPLKYSDDLVPIVLLEPRTPKTPYEGADTPLQKFNALSCKLKDSLVHEYLEFLNTATKEELLALKGIGQKRAEYILQLREESPRPLKTLNDLEKIGLSSKQVHNIFRGTASGIFA